MGWSGRLLICAVFGAAFGVVEGAVVVYLRELYYPEGFVFPLVEIPPRVMWTEIAREAATIVCLLAVAFLAERRPLRRFAVFAFAFAVWDLVYYLVLKIVLDWPVGLLDWDVLFLIPLPWIGPVLAPVLVSLALIFAAVVILRAPADDPFVVLRPRDWGAEVLAGLVILATFFWNTGALARGEAPASYPWWLFAVGLGGGLGWFLWRLRRRAVERPVK